MWRGRLALKYLTPAQVAELIHLSKRKVLELPIPKIRVGDGRGKILYAEDDVRSYLRERTEYPALKGEKTSADGISKRQKKVGFPVLPSRQDLEAIRLGHGAGGPKRGSKIAH
jgi:hypothetical protein